MDTFYIFCGEGSGVPGLPHRVSKSEAEALGVADLLDAAIANGNYKPEAQPKRVARKTDGAPDKEN